MTDQPHEILITGANGQIGTLLRHALQRPDRHLRLLDVNPQPALTPGEAATLIVGSFLDADTMDRATQGVEAIVHLGGLSTVGFDWPGYLEVNINGTREVLEAARRCGVPRIIYASSNHAVGFYRHGDEPVPDNLFPQPDSLYGVSKAASESLCSLYHDRYGLDAICLRIGSFSERPVNPRMLWSWLSPGDCTRLVEAALGVASPGFRLVWGISANTRGIVSMHEGHEIGFFPVDDAEVYAQEIADDDGAAPWRDLVGGPYTAPDVE
jgi:nucleoside-diphosphate-sugar epimerase